MLEWKSGVDVLLDQMEFILGLAGNTCTFLAGTGIPAKFV
jgi:hypothetical protein